MWRVFHRALATRLALFKRRVVVSPICPICNEQEKSVEHMFFLCPWVEHVWFGGQLNNKMNKNEIDTFSNWLHSLIVNNMSSKQDKTQILSQVAFTCWNIWKKRCNAIFNQKSVPPLQIIHKTSCAYAAFMEITGRTQMAISGMWTSSDNHGNLQGNSQPISTWSPPDRSLFKVNVDASWNATTKKGNAS